MGYNYWVVGPTRVPRVALGLVAQPIPDPSRVWVQNPAGLPGPMILARHGSLVGSPRAGAMACVS